MTLRLRSYRTFLLADGFDRVSWWIMWISSLKSDDSVPSTLGRGDMVGLKANLRCEKRRREESSDAQPEMLSKEENLEAITGKMKSQGCSGRQWYK